MAKQPLHTVVSRYVRETQGATIASVEDVQRVVAEVLRKLDTDRKQVAFIEGFTRDDFVRAFIEQLTVRVAPAALQRAEAAGRANASRLTGVRRTISDSLTAAYKAQQAQALAVQFSGNMRGISDQVRALLASVATEGRGPATVIDQLREDLRSGGPIFGQMTGGRPILETMKKLTSQAAGRATSMATVQLLDPGSLSSLDAEQSMLSQLHRWVSVQGKNTCDPCANRHGEVATYDEWLEDGLPGGDWGNPCTTSCQCQLVPEQARRLDDEDLAEPFDAASLGEGDIDGGDDDFDFDPFDRSSELDDLDF